MVGRRGPHRQPLAGLVQGVNRYRERAEVAGHLRSGIDRVRHLGILLGGPWSGDESFGAEYLAADLTHAAEPSQACSGRHDAVMEITLVRGDITEQWVDAIVNAANSSLLGGGGVDGAIHRRGGPAILAECRALRASAFLDGLPAGQAVATTAGGLPARWGIPTGGPVWAGSEDRSGLLRSCFLESLRVADELGAATVAFPAISTGVYRWPIDSAARIAAEAVRTARTRVTEVRFVLFDETA